MINSDRASPAIKSVKFQELIPGNIFQIRYYFGADSMRFAVLRFRTREALNFQSSPHNTTIGLTPMVLSIIADL